MTADQMEYIKTFASILTPVLIFGFGFFLLRRTEGIKTKAARQSEHITRHAEYFFETYQKYLEALERALAVATILMTVPDKKSNRAIALWSEIEGLYPDISELELRIRRCVKFSPNNGAAASRIARECLDIFAKLLSSREGPVDPITEKMVCFDNAARLAHKEMLEKESAPFWQKIFSLILGQKKP